MDSVTQPNPTNKPNSINFSFVLLLCLSIPLIAIITFFLVQRFFLNKRSWVIPLINVHLSELPLKANGTTVKMGNGVFYNFEAEILNVKNTTPITIEVKDQSNMPVFTLIPETTIFRIQNKQKSPITVNELQPGQKVRLIDFYNFTKKQWFLQQVIVLED